MKLISPNGVTVSVSDEAGEQLLSGNHGYQRSGSAAKPQAPAPADEPKPARVGRSQRKNKNTNTASSE